MTSNIAENEYSLLHYGFTPDTFFKDFSETVLDEMALIVQHTLKELSSPTNKLEEQDKLIATTLRLHDTWSQRAEVVLQKLKPTIQEFFTIPKNVLLPTDKVHEKQYSEEEVAKLEEEVKCLEDKYVKELNAIKLYKAEIAILEKLEPVQKTVDQAVNAVNSFSGTLNKIKELERLAETHNEYKKLINANEDESDDSDDFTKLEGKFKIS